MQITMMDTHEQALRATRDERLANNRREQPTLYARYKYSGSRGTEVGQGPPKLLLDPTTQLPLVQLLEPVLNLKKGRRQEGASSAAAAAQGGEGVGVDADLSAAADEFCFGVETPLRATLKHLMQIGIRGKIEVDPAHLVTAGGGGAAAVADAGLGGGADDADGDPGDEATFGAVFYVLYAQVAFECQRFVRSDTYTVLLILVIALFAALVGVETGDTSKEDSRVLDALAAFCVFMFATECLVKIVAEFNMPQRYFKDPWNLFDFLVALGGLYSLYSGVDNVALQLARLLRLLQVFKLTNRLPRLALVTEALVYGMRSMVWVALLMLLFNYLAAIIGVIIFRENDPFYFGKLGDAAATLWLVETFQNWEQPMMVNVMGCDVYGYGSRGGGRQALGETFDGPYPTQCTKPFAAGALAVTYFCIVATVGGLVLPTLLTAVITASTVHMGRNKEERAFNLAEVKSACDEAPDYLHPMRVKLLGELFENLDLSGDGTLEPKELFPAFAALGDETLRHSSPAIVATLFRMVDKSGDGSVDFSEVKKRGENKGGGIY